MLYFLSLTGSKFIQKINNMGKNIWILNLILVKGTRVVVNMSIISFTHNYICLLKQRRTTFRNSNRKLFSTNKSYVEITMFGYPVHRIPYSTQMVSRPLTFIYYCIKPYNKSLYTVLIMFNYIFDTYIYTVKVSYSTYLTGIQNFVKNILNMK